MIEGMVIILLSAILIAFIIIWIRDRIKIKVLREEKDDMEEVLLEERKKTNYMEKTMPIELYRLLVRNEGRNAEFVPTFLPSVVMNLNTIHFTERIHSMQANDIFEFINHILMKTVPYVCQKNGIIDQFYEAGFTAYFEERYEDALVTAISISEVIEAETEKSDLFQDFAIGMSYGSVLAGLAGTEQRNSLVTVSEYTGISSFLQSIARTYDARILITGTLRSKIEDFEQKFNARKIGYIYITALDALEEIYEVFDGNHISVRNHKRKTKIIFEKGVEYYAKGEYQKARQYFIEVFKTNGYDRAANEYLNRCEQLITDGTDAEKQPQIETY